MSDVFSPSSSWTGISNQMSLQQWVVCCFMTPYFINFVLVGLLLKKSLQVLPGMLSSIIMCYLQLNRLVSSSSTPAKRYGNASIDLSDVYVPFVNLLHYLICIELSENIWTLHLKWSISNIHPLLLGPLLLSSFQLCLFCLSFFFCTHTYFVACSEIQQEVLWLKTSLHLLYLVLVL